MKEKIKKIMIGYLPGFVLGVIIAISISVIAATYFPSNDVTYDNKESGLHSSNVKGAIDELYTECTKEPPAGDQIIEEAGLEKNPYECRYFFTGANPNNYLTFNDEEAGWRIISAECDGTIKIMRNDSIGNYYWDTGRSNNWARPATLNTDLNETYYNRLNSIAQSQVVVHDFGVGAVTLGNDNLANQINDENSIKWNGKVALPTVSEYLRTNANKNCKTLLSYDNNYDVCKNTVWMYFNSGQWWLLSPEASFEMNAFHVNYLGLVHYVTVSGNNYAIRPALYLSADVTLTGSGTQSDPYVINS